MRILNQYSDQIYSLMRFVAGFLYACHGAQKLFGVLGGPQMLHNPLMLAAGIIEFVGGVLIAIGVFTTFAAFIASGEMAVGYFLAHAPHGFWPIRNRGELAVLFSFVFLYIASRGDAGWNLRRLMRGKRP
jgi:putative oxidoreductase